MAMKSCMSYTVLNGKEWKDRDSRSLYTNQLVIGRRIARGANVGAAIDMETTAAAVTTSGAAVGAAVGASVTGSGSAARVAGGKVAASVWTETTVMQGGLIVVCDTLRGGVTGRNGATWGEG